MRHYVAYILPNGYKAQTSRLAVIRYYTALLAARDALPPGPCVAGRHRSLRMVLADAKLRAEYTVKLKQFLSSLDGVLPRPEGAPFVRDAKKLAFIYARARSRYKDALELGKDVGAKVRKLIDDHVVSMGVDPKIPPISLTDANFDSHVSRQGQKPRKWNMRFARISANT